MILFNEWAKIVKPETTRVDGMSRVAYKVVAIERVRLDFTSDRSRKDLQILANSVDPGVIPDRTVLIFAQPRTKLKAGSLLQIKSGPYKGLWDVKDAPVPVGVSLGGRVSHYEAIACESQRSDGRKVA